MSELKNNKAEKFRQLRADYGAQLPGKVARLSQEWQVVEVNSGNSDSVSADAFNRLKGVVHNLAGSAGAFGYSELSEVARELELLLSRSQEFIDCMANDKDEISAFIVEISSVATLEPSKVELPKAEAVPTAINRSPRDQLVYVVDDDPLLAREISDQLLHYGYEVKTFENSTQAELALKRQPPTAMVIDLGLPEGILAGADLVSKYEAASSERIPLIFISARDDWAARLAVVRAGGGLYLTKPVDFRQLLDGLDAVTEWQNEEQYRILIVDDERVLAEHYALVLADAGMDTKVVGDITELLNAISEFQPDLILLDIFMPGCSGLEAAAVVRQKSELLSVPIVYLSTEVNVQQQMQALQFGGDDFLQKPISDELLVASVGIHVRRFRKLRSYMSMDALTGLLNHATLKIRLESEVQRAIRQRSTLVYAMLDIDRFKHVNDTYGHPVGDEVIKNLSRMLKQRLRKSDIAGRYGGEEFAVILPDTSLASAQDLLNELREQFAVIKHRNKFTCTFSVGLAAAPPYLESNALIKAADDALYLAKNSGRNCTRVCE
jgi:diguanylate cyclase (GGDEF)-like protein